MAKIKKIFISDFYIQVALNEVTLEETLRAELPCYMLPKPVKLPVIPTLVNGKVDRQALLKRYINNLG